MRGPALAIALVAVGALAGCGDDDATTTASATTSSTQPSTTTASTTTESSSTTTTTLTTTQPADAPAPTPEEAAIAVLTAEGSPRQACETYVTAAFVAISYGSKQNCRAARTPNALADSIEVRSSNETATGVHLVVVPDGGPYDGAKVEVEVVGDDDSFRVDSLQAHVPAGP